MFDHSSYSSKILCKYIRYKSHLKSTKSDKTTHNKINYNYVNFLNKTNNQTCEKKSIASSIKKKREKVNSSSIKKKYMSMRDFLCGYFCWFSYIDYVLGSFNYAHSAHWCASSDAMILLHMFFLSTYITVPRKLVIKNFQVDGRNQCFSPWLKGGSRSIATRRLPAELRKHNRFPLPPWLFCMC